MTGFHHFIEEKVKFQKNVQYELHHSSPQVHLLYLQQENGKKQLCHHTIKKIISNLVCIRAAKNLAWP